jgi:uncharacterized membrane protein YfcA
MTDLLLWLPAFIGAGLVTGLIAGLMGIGGGSILVPILVFLLSAQGFPPQEIMHLALGTSMATIVFTSISSIRAHHQHGAILWPVVRGITPGILFGTLLGTKLVTYVPARELAIIFTLFIVYVAIQMLVNFKPKPSRNLPGNLGLGLVGTGIGGFSCLVAIGGGALSVPFMTWCNVRMQNAIATSAAIGFPIAIGGALGYIINGLHAEHLPFGSLGFVHLPSTAALAVGSVLTAPVGARLAHRLPVATLKRIFAGILVLLASKMLWNILHG